MEDDPGDALLVQELLAASGEQLEVAWVKSSAEARSESRRAVDCALVDLGLPGTSGLDALGEVVDACPNAAVIVLTGMSDRGLALAAVAAGAQDYLMKDEVDSQILDRTIRLAAERRRTERAAVALAEANLRQAHNERLVRGLLPRFRVKDPSLEFVTRYLPGNSGEVLGGDFLDAVELADGTVRAIIGDVAGHGPDEAAVGVNLRIAWRALTLAGSSPDDTLARLADLVIHDVGVEELFVTVADLSLSPSRESLELRLAGHPSPLLLEGKGVTELDGQRGSPLGVAIEEEVPVVEFDLPPAWRLLLFTDGLIEGRDGDSTRRLGSDGLVEYLRGRADAGVCPAERLATDIHAEASRRHGGTLPDDVAIMVISAAKQP